MSDNRLKSLIEMAEYSIAAFVDDSKRTKYYDALKDIKENMELVERADLDKLLKTSQEAIIEFDYAGYYTKEDEVWIKELREKYK